jgi:hypothetical protein
LRRPQHVSFATIRWTFCSDSLHNTIQRAPQGADEWLENPGLNLGAYQLRSALEKRQASLEIADNSQVLFVGIACTSISNWLGEA